MSGDRLSPGPMLCIIYFHDGHTIEKHFAAVGERYRGEYQHLMYVSEMRSERAERVRRDPGVKEVVEVTEQQRKAAQRSNRTFVTHPASGFTDAPGYLVHFASRSYTVSEHFAKIGLRFECNEYEGSGYHADLTQSQLEAVFSDWNVDEVTRNAYGKYD